MLGLSAGRERVQVAIGVITVLLLLLVVVAQLVFAWDQITHDGFLYALPAINQVFIFASFVMSVVALVLVCEASGRRLVLMGAGALGLLMLCSTAVLTGNAWAAIAALLVLVASWQVGVWILRALAVAVGTDYRGLLATALGFGVIAALVYVEGITIGITWWLTALPVLGVGAVGVTMLVRPAIRDPRAVGCRIWRRCAAMGRVEIAAWAIAFLVLGCTAIWTAAPDVQYDPNWGKAWLPAYWADTGSISANRIDAQSFSGGSTLYLATVGHLTGGPAIGRYLALFTGALLAACAWRVARPQAGSAIAALLGLAFLVTPHVVWQMGTANDDLALCLLAGGLALAAVSIRQFGWRSGLVIGALAGGAINGKLHLLAFAMVVLVGWWAIAPLRTKLPALGGLLLGLVVIASPQFIKRWVDVGNPVFPGLNNIFKSPWWPPVNERFNLPFGSQSTLADALRLPLTMVTDPTRYMEAVPRGVFGVLPILLMVFALTGWWGASAGRRVVWAATIVALIAWWEQLRYLRYLLPYSYVAILLVPVYLGALRRPIGRIRRSWRAGLGVIAAGVLVVASAGTATATFFNIPERVPVHVAVGREDPMAYLERNMAGVRAVQAINRLTPAGSRIVVDSSAVYQRSLTEDGRYLLPSWQFSGLLNWLHQSGQISGDATTPAAWRRFGVNWAALTVQGLASGAYSEGFSQFVKEHMVQRWSDGTSVLYEIRASDSPVRAVG